MVVLLRTVFWILIASSILGYLVWHGLAANFIDGLMVIAMTGQLIAWARYVSVQGMPTFQTFRIYHDISNKMLYRVASPILILTIAFLVALLGYVTSPVFYHLAVAVPFFSIWITLRRYLPATILVLGRSNEDAFWLQSEVDLPFLRTVSLLDVWDQNFDLNHPDRRVMKFDILRTSDEEHWSQVVGTLMDACPLIVMDVTRDSEPVQYELRQLVARELTYKTVCVSECAPDAPALRAAKNLGIDTSGFSLVSKTKVRRLMHFVLSRRSRLPTAQRPIVEHLQKIG